MLSGGLAMALTKVNIGKFIESYSQKCCIPNLTVYDVSGINRDKEFFEPSKQVGSDTSKYQVVPSGYFACNLMHVGRDVVLPISLNYTSNNKYVSPAYSVFKVTDTNLILPEFFFMLLKSDEKDRYFWFNTDSSVREGMSWEDFCAVEIDIPPVEVQQKYVNIYKSMLENQKCYETALDDLKLSIDALLDEYKKTSSKQSIGDLLEEIDIRNSENKFETAYGVNITKQFMPSVASSIDLHNYKIVNENQFVFSGMQTGRDECIRIALLKNHVPVVVSPAYTVLQVKSDNVLPEFIQMWFSRAEADRLGWFMSASSIRANLDLSAFFEIKIPIPDIEIQRSIANIYKVYMERKQINEQLKEQIKNICPILIRGAIKECLNG